MTDASDDFKLDAIFKLINGENKTEEKVAGIILANKYLFVIEDDKVIVNIVHKIVKEISAQFVLKMVQSVGQELVHQAGLTLLVLSCKSKKTILLYKKDIAILVRLVFLTGTKASARHQIMTVIKSLLMVSSSSNIDTALHTLLSDYLLHSHVMNPIDLLEFFVDILHIVPVAGPSITLSHGDAATLRSLFVQAFHGAAPESVRDRALSLCRDILSMKTNTSTSTAYTLSSQWTTLGTVRPPSVVVRESEEGIERKASSNADDSFPILLCSIVRGELHLVGEELLSLSSLTSSSLSPSSSSESTPPEEGEGGPSATRLSDAMIVGRIVRCTSMHGTCMSLLDCFLELLVGGALSDLNTGEDEADVTSSSSAWADLPYQVSLDVKKALDGVLSELLEFTKECGKVLCAPPPSSSGVPLMSASQLRNVASRSVMTVTGFAAEDEGMHALMITYLGDVLACSVISTVTEAAASGLIQSEASHRRQNRVDLVWNAVVSVDIDTSCGLPGQDETISIEVVEELVDPPLQPLAQQQEVPLAGDVLPYLLPCLLNVLSALLEEDSEASPAEKKEQRVQLDRFYNALDTLMPRATELVCVLLTKISQILVGENSAGENKSKSSGAKGVTSQRTALNRGASVAVLALDLLLRVFSAKDSDLRILLRSEGEAAFSQIVALQAAQVRSLYAAMKGCLKPCDGFMKLLEREFESSVERLATSDSGPDDAGGVEGDALDLLCSAEQLLETLQAGTHLLDGYAKISSAVNC